MILAPLEKSSDIYKIHIPIEVEGKIRHLCNRISSVEWSGILFYTTKGSYEKNNLEIKCVDIFPMDIGNSTYTEFEMSPDVISYVTEHPELLDCYTGLIHSHNIMKTFFSGTDLGTLREEGNNRNHFVSLIVNNEGTYTAAITRKLSIVSNIKANYTYKSFEDVEKSGKTSTQTTKEIIFYNFLDVIKEEIVEPFKDIDLRLQEIKEKVKKSEAPIATTSNRAFYPTMGNLFYQDPYMESSPVRNIPVPKEKREEIVISKETVKASILQLITGSISMSANSKLDTLDWVNKHMVKVFDERFKGNLVLYQAWAETMAEFVIMNFIPAKYSLIEENYASQLALTILTEMEQFPTNKYLKIIKDSIQLWII